MPTELKWKSRKLSASAWAPFCSRIAGKPETWVLIHIPWAYRYYYFSWKNNFAQSCSIFHGECAILSNAGDEVDLVCMICSTSPHPFLWFFVHTQYSYIFCLEHIYFPPELFSIAFLSGLQIKSNRYIAELCDIIFWAYSTMYWIMPVHASLLLFSADWERGTVGPANSLGARHYGLNQDRHSGCKKRLSKCSLHKSIWSKVHRSGYSTIAHIVLSA